MSVPLSPTVQEHLQRESAREHRAVDERYEDVRRFLVACETETEQLFLVSMLADLEPRVVKGVLKGVEGKWIDNPPLGLNPRLAFVQDHLWSRIRSGEIPDDRFRIRIFVRPELNMAPLGFTVTSRIYRPDFLITLDRSEYGDGTYEPASLLHAAAVIDIERSGDAERSDEQRQQDGERDRMLTRAGYAVFRFTDAEILREIDRAKIVVRALFDLRSREVFGRLGP